MALLRVTGVVDFSFNESSRDFFGQKLRRERR